MPTQLREFNSIPNALLVVLDYRQEEERDVFSESLAERFEETQYLYLKGEACKKNGQELYRYIEEKVHRYDVVMPGSSRFVFCHYLQLRDLTEDWIRQWQECARGFQDRVPVDEAYQQYHVIFLSYRAADILGEEQSRQAAANLKILGTELPELAHVVYLLYARGFEKIGNQEEGAAQLLYLLGRDDAAGMLFPMHRRTCLKMLNYSDFSEEKAEMWRNTIADLNNWMRAERDPGLLVFLDSVRGMLLEPVQTLRDAEMEFDLRADVYPVHIDDFEKTGFLPGSPMVSRIGLDHEIIQKRKAEYFGDLQQKLAAEIPFQKLVRQVQDRMYYRDLQQLRDLLNRRDGDSLESQLRASAVSGGEDRAANEIAKLIDAVCGRIRSLLQEKLEHIDEERRKKQLERQHAQQELEVAGRYNGLSDCFAKINQETVFHPIDGMNPEFQKNTCLIGSNCYSDWYTGQYIIDGVDMVSYSADMDPLDIALLKTGDLLELAAEDAERNLLRVLH